MAQAWAPQPSGTTVSLRGVSAVNDKIAWASGAAGTYVITTDAGKSWRPAKVSGAAWKLQFNNPDEKGFYDALAFWDAAHGILLGDPVNGHFAVLTKALYIPNWREGPMDRTLVLRSAGEPSGLIEAVRRQARELDSGIPVLSSRSMVQEFNQNIAQERIIAILCGFFGSLALLLASIGLYGVMSHTVTRRTREIGIRMALGARREGVLWMMLRDAAMLVIAGAAIGVPAALAITRLISSFLYGVTPHDPVVMTGACVLLLAVTLLASYLPARRATKVDPMIALRYE